MEDESIPSKIILDNLMYYTTATVTFNPGIVIIKQFHKSNVIIVCFLVVTHMDSNTDIELFVPLLTRRS